MASEEYRRRAAECLLFAESAANHSLKIWLVDMAHAWLRLANLAEKEPVPTFQQQQQIQSPKKQSDGD